MTSPAPASGRTTAALMHLAADPYRLMIAEVRDYAIFLVAVDEAIASWNLGAERIFGYPAAEAVGTPAARLCAHADTAGWRPEDSFRVAADQGRYEDESVMARRDGTHFWAVCTITALADGGRPVGFAVVVRDITRRRRLEAELRDRAAELAEVNARLETVIRRSPAGIAFVTPDYRHTHVNDTLAAINGRPAADHIGRTVAEVVPTLWPTLEPLFRQVRDTLRPVTDVEVTGRLAATPGVDRTWLVGYHPVLDPAGALLGIGVMVVEVTERKRVEQLQRDRERMFRAVAEHSSDGLVLATRAGGTRFVSPAVTAVLGYTSDEFIALTPADMHHPDDLDRVWAVMREATARPGATVRVTHRMRHRAGGWRWIDSTVTDWSDDPSIAAIVINLRDVTDRELAQQHVRRTEEKLRQAAKLEAVGQLAGGVAHDFNNLLTAILGFSDLILADMTPADPNWAAVATIRDAGERAAGLTGQLLAFSRKQVVEPKVVDLNAVVAQVERMLRRLIGEDVALVTVLDPALARVRIDPTQVEQVVMNLAVNARDAMPTGGRLTVETRNTLVRPDDAANYPELAPGLYAQMSVTDTGAGMTDGVKARIFEPFFTTKDEGKGTGLGLATVYGIAKQAGGQVSVYSEVGVGTTFRVLLPATDAAPAGSPVSPHPDDGGRETILLVEDEDAVRKITRILLEAQGYHVLMAANGTEAVRVAADHAGPIHLVLTDVVMPEMGGRQLAETVRAARPGVKVLYMSGYTDDAVVRHGIIQATDAFLQKPFTPLVLARKVRGVLDGG